MERTYGKYLNTISHENKISKEELIYRYVFSLKNLNYALIGSINKRNIVPQSRNVNSGMSR